MKVIVLYFLLREPVISAMHIHISGHKREVLCLLILRGTRKKLFMHSYGLNCTHTHPITNSYVEALTLIPQNVTVFGDKIFEERIKLKGGLYTIPTLYIKHILPITRKQNISLFHSNMVKLRLQVGRNFRHGDAQCTAGQCANHVRFTVEMNL